MSKTYAEKLKDPRWQKRRLQLLEAADWKCRQCGSKTETLHVHREDVLLVIGALDSLSVALADDGHVWTEGEREIYEQAITLLNTELVNEHPVS